MRRALKLVQLRLRCKTPGEEIPGDKLQALFSPLCEHVADTRGDSAGKLVGAKLAANIKSGNGLGSDNAVRNVSRNVSRDGRRSSLAWAPLMSIAVAALAVEIPFLFLGMPSGHDVEFHLYSWLEVLSQWKLGIVYPRWAALANFAYGEPRFIFYPPASWALGAALSAIFPWTLAASIYIWLALLLAGVSMFVLARQWLDRRDATFAAMLYAVNPYHLVIVYWRSAFAELLASSLLPLLLLLLLRADEKGRRITVYFALLLASAWLINAPAAVMIHYSLALLILVVAWQRRSPRVLLVGTFAVVLGAALAAVYLLPAVYEQKWVTIAQAVSAGSRPQDSFLFIHTTDADHDAFNHLISWIAIVEILLTVVAAWTARSWRRRHPTLWYSLVAWAGACSVLMLSITNVLWRILPKLQYMQFPWRWMLCLGIPFTLLTVLGVRRWSMRVAFYLATLAVLSFGWRHFQAPWWDNASDLREMQDNMQSGEGYEGVDEYTPVGADPSSVSKDARRVTAEGPAHAAIHVSQWTPEFKLFTAEMSAPDNLALRLFNYPAWRVNVNGRQLHPGVREGTGQMLVPVEAGANEVQLSFVRSWDRTAGGWISLLALIVAFVLWKFPSSSG